MATSTITATKNNLLSFLAGFSQASPGAIRTNEGSEDPESLKVSPENGERPTSAIAISPTTNICNSDNEGTPTASDNDDSSKPTGATAVSPSRSVESSDAEEEDNHDEIRPISLDELKATENPSDPRIDAELVKELSFGSDSDGKERDWTNKISVVNDSSGNLIEDLECDDSSASSVTTIIDSEQSSSAGDDDDLEDTFRSDDEETEGENDEGGGNQGSLDPLQGRWFVIFGDDEDEGIKNNNDNGEATNGNTTRAKTSSINPMTGKRSLTDDMQEWKDTVLSSWTLTPTKKRKKYTKRKKGTKNEHTYLLRRNIDQNKKVADAAANINKILESSAKNPRRKKCRLLQSIAPFNHPGVSEAHREFSSLLEPQSQKDGAKTKLQTESIIPNNVITTNVQKRGQELSQQRSEKRKTKRGCPPKEATHRPNISRNTKKKTLQTTRSHAKGKGENQGKKSQSIKPSPKSSQKGVDEPLNFDIISNGSTRVAKRFIFNPTRRKGQEKRKIFYGTVTGKIDDDSVESGFPMWRIVYDDGDEEELDLKDLRDALHLYKYAKRWDRKCRDEKKALTGRSKKKPNDERCAVEWLKSKPQLKVQKPSAKMPQPLPRQMLEYRKPHSKNGKKGLEMTTISNW